MANLGFVGLGVMGGEMVNRLLGKGHSVTGYNRTRSKAEWLVKKGMNWADSPRAVALAGGVYIFHGYEFRGARSGDEWARRNAGSSEAGQDFRGYEHREPCIQPGDCGQS